MKSSPEMLLPVMLMTGRGRIQPSSLRELASCFPESAQTGILRAAALAQAAQELLQAQREMPAPVPRSPDPLNRLQTLSRVMGMSLPGLDRMGSQLARMQQLRSVMSALPAMMQMGSAMTHVQQMPVWEESLPAVEDLQAALSRVNPAMVQRVRDLARTLSGEEQTP